MGRVLGRIFCGGSSAEVSGMDSGGDSIEDSGVDSKPF